MPRRLLGSAGRDESEFSGLRHGSSSVADTPWCQQSSPAQEGQVRPRPAGGDPCRSPSAALRRPTDGPAAPADRDRSHDTHVVHTAAHRHLVPLPASFAPSRRPARTLDDAPHGANIAGHGTRIEYVSENLSRPDRLRLVCEWQASRPGEQIAPSLSRRNAGGAPQTDAVRTGDCAMSGKRTRTMRRDQALHALTQDGIAVCPYCRPDRKPREPGVL
ncbi:DUF6233 domain-containing protein [Streptomyces sp. NPDC005151]